MEIQTGCEWTDGPCMYGLGIFNIFNPHPLRSREFAEEPRYACKQPPKPSSYSSYYNGGNPPCVWATQARFIDCRIYIGTAGEAFRFVSFRFVSFRSSPNNFCTATRVSFSLTLSFLFPFRLLHHPPFISFFFSLLLCRALHLSLSLSLSLSHFSLFVRRSSRLRIFVRIAIAEGFFPLASLVPLSARTRPNESSFSLPLSFPVFLPFSFLCRCDLRVKQYFIRADTQALVARPEKTGRVKIVSTCSMTDRVPPPPRWKYEPELATTVLILYALWI